VGERNKTTVRISTRTRHTIAAAKRSAKNAKAVAGEAIGAARKTMAGTVSTRTKRTIVHAAKRGAKNVKAVAGEAIGAAAKAATEVVLQETDTALAEGYATLRRSSPAMQRAVEKTARQAVDRRSTRRSTRSS
jgi:hypothetical protein